MKSGTSTASSKLVTTDEPGVSQLIASSPRRSISEATGQQMRTSKAPARKWPVVRMPALPQVGQNNPPLSDAEQEWFASRARQLKREVDDMRNAAAAAKPLGPGDKHEAAYLLARRVDGRPVEGDLLEMLKRANETVNETRAHLHRGRGNVKPDLKASGYGTHRITEATRDVTEAQDEGRGLPGGVKAGVVAHTGAGKCSEHAQVATFVHAARLKIGEQITCVEHSEQDHSWAVLSGKGQQVVLDPWSESPAIDAADCVYMKQPAKLIEHETVKSGGQARRAAAEFRRGLQKEGPRLQPLIDQNRQARDAKNDRPGFFDVHSNESVVNADFARRAKSALKTVPTPEGGKLSATDVRLRKAVLKVRGLVSEEAREQTRRLGELKTRAKLQTEVLATQSARILGANVGDAAKGAADIVKDAKDLRQPIKQRSQE